MNKFVEKFVEAVRLQKHEINPKIVINAIHYMMSVIACAKRSTLQNIDGQISPLNYYGITFGNSGRGKDFSVSLAHKVAMKSLDKYREVAATMLTQNNADFPIPAIEYKEGTASGFIQDRTALDVLRIGSTNVRVEELVSVLKNQDFEQVLNMLVESWQEGSTQARSFKSYVSPPIKFVPSNCLLYSSPEGFRSNQNKQFQNFVDVLANGMARRSYVVFDDSETEYEDEPTDEQLLKYIDDLKKSQVILDELGDHAYEVITSDTKFIYVTPDIELMFRKYEVSNKNRTVDNPMMPNAAKAELLARSYKIKRLAGLYAYFDGTDTITKENVEDAIEWVESLNRDLSIAMAVETSSEKIYDYLLKVKRYASQTDVMKHYNMTAREFKENIDEVFTVAYDNGSVLQSKVFDKDAKVVKYNLIRGKKTDPNKIICSASDSMSEKYNGMEISWGDVQKLVRGEYGKNYSAGTFLNGHRTKDNYIKRQNLIVFDVDEGMSIDDALLYLGDFVGYIATTRNHMKEKNGSVGERFRIIMPSKFEFNLDHETYVSTLKNLALYYEISADFPTIEPARLYYSHSDCEIYRLGGSELIDLRMFMPDTKEVENTKKAIDHTYQVSKNKNCNGLDKYFLTQCTAGARNNGLIKYGLALLDKKGFSLDEAMSKVMALNSMLLEPLDEIEIERTIFVTMSRRELGSSNA